MKREETIQIRINASDKDRYQKFAEALDMTLSEWVRSACEYQIAKRQPDMLWSHDLSKVPADLQREWILENLCNERYIPAL